jgi:hypothetical protein
MLNVYESRQIGNKGASGFPTSLRATFIANSGAVLVCVFFWFCFRVDSFLWLAASWAIAFLEAYVTRVAPPVLLFLGHSEPNSHKLALQVANRLDPMKVVSLLDPARYDFSPENPGLVVQSIYRMRDPNVWTKWVAISNAINS